MFWNIERKSNLIDPLFHMFIGFQDIFTSSSIMLFWPIVVCCYVTGLWCGNNCMPWTFCCGVGHIRQCHQESKRGNLVLRPIFLHQGLIFSPKANKMEKLNFNFLSFLLVPSHEILCLDMIHSSNFSLEAPYK